ncbi:DNA helicase UvrD [Candidatus Pacearchaeota archaeon CG_4_9_14_3_um_filter_31_7]|nr:MAG: DNA helicase UvrD [Candidatus Pacearchaeota archaeon CG_4_9_14_3_um_filter_31_7]
MKIYADMHVHSKYSQATSLNLTLENLEKYAKIKGITLLGTGDFTHPKWIQEIKENLTEENGILFTKNKFPFVLQTEISLMYSKNGKGRRIHHLVLAPSLDVVEQITQYLLKHGRVDYDGRPIFKIDSEQFVSDLKNISSDIEIIPAHAWTPWFGIFGSNSGFDSLKECFGNETKNIHAIETGMSSSPDMNWRIKELDDKQIISFSDLHSFWPWRLGREATIFDFKELNYKNLIKAIRTGENFIGTIETDPNYGKYHYDGHRLCNFSCSPKESKKLNGICPICKKPLTIGVEYRVEQLASFPLGRKSPIAKPFFKVLPLHELISSYKQLAISTKTVQDIYNKFIERFGNEINILLNAEEKELMKIDEKISNLIMQNRVGKIKVKPGYDGIYGEAVIDVEEKQKRLF